MRKSVGEVIADAAFLEGEEMKYHEMQTHNVNRNYGIPPNSNNFYVFNQWKCHGKKYTIFLHHYFKRK